MGGGAWDATTYHTTTGAKINAGTTFGYDKTAKATKQYTAHKELDPKQLNAAGVNVRESRDGDDHPNSVPIVIGFDATGSMGSVPKTVQTKLAGLFGLLLRKGYVEDPQISVGVYGDAKCDYVPLQISQFESDNRIDENLDKIFLEGNGGGNAGETQSLLWYYLLHHTVTDAWEKRQKKGYLFMIADEVPLQITADEVKTFVGDGEPLGTLDTKEMAKALQERWEVVVLLIDNNTAHYQNSEKVYQELFGKRNVVIVENPDTIAEVIGLVIGVKEGTVDSLDQAEEDLKDAGSSAVAIRNAVNAVGSLINMGNPGGPLVKGSLDLDVDETVGATRL